jgi:hypothetical protein
LQRFERLRQRYESALKKERPLSGLSLEALSLEYAQYPAQAVPAPRRAKKLCAPCCHVITTKSQKYCDAVSVPGEMYCAAHLRPAATETRRPIKFPFRLMQAFKPLSWRIRE